MAPEFHFWAFTWQGYIGVGILLFVLLYMHAKGKGIDLDAVKDAVSFLNSKGGNILVLLALTVFFFKSAMEMYYRMIYMIASKAITPDNAVAINGWTFVTGVAFGGAFAALLKSLGGEEPQQKVPPDFPKVPPTEKAP